MLRLYPHRRVQEFTRDQFLFKTQVTNIYAENSVKSLKPSVGISDTAVNKEVMCAITRHHSEFNPGHSGNEYTALKVPSY